MAVQLDLNPSSPATVLEVHELTLTLLGHQLKTIITGKQAKTSVRWLGTNGYTFRSFNCWHGCFCSIHLFRVKGWWQAAVRMSLSSLANTEASPISLISRMHTERRYCMKSLHVFSFSCAPWCSCSMNKKKKVHGGNPTVTGSVSVLVCKITQNLVLTLSIQAFLDFYVNGCCRLKTQQVYWPSLLHVFIWLMGTLLPNAVYVYANRRITCNHRDEKPNNSTKNVIVLWRQVMRNLVNDARLSDSVVPFLKHMLFSCIKN